MNCHKPSCEFYDQQMTDNCSNGEPPDVEHCKVRMGTKRGLKSYLNEQNATILRLTRELSDKEAEVATAFQQGAEAAREAAARVAGDYELAYPGKLACGITLRQWIARAIRSMPLPERKG